MPKSPKKPTKPKAKTRQTQPKPKPELNQLTFRQRMFVSYFLGKAGGNATEAARMAGYASPHPEGARLLRNATIKAAVDAKLGQAAMSADEVLARLSDQAAIDFSKYIVNSEEGLSVDVIKMKADGLGHLIKGIKKTKFGDQVEFHDAHAALDKLARYHSLYKDREVVQVTYADVVREMEQAAADYEAENPPEPEPEVEVES